MGLISVVSLPRPFVFRVSPDDPHPPPHIRVKLSAALGGAFYPQPAWRRLVEVSDPTTRRTGWTARGAACSRTSSERFRRWWTRSSTTARPH